MNINFLRLIELARRVIAKETGELNPELFSDVQDVDMWKQLYQLARMQEIEVLLHEATKDISLPEEVQGKFYEVYNRAVRKEAIMHIEVSNYFELLDREGITYMPVKGWLLKNLYEKPYLRTMTDVDVLIQKGDFANACEAIQTLGFHEEIIGECHNVYIKKPVTEVEVHHQLFGEDSVLYEWGQSIMTRSEDFKMSDEDTYIYLIAHMAKHFTKDGAGMRNLIDYYLFKQKYVFDKEQQSYIDSTLEQLGLKIFDERIAEVVTLWFEGGEYNSETEGLTEYIMDGGLYGKAGNAEAMVRSDSKNKFTWMLKEVFPSYKKMKTYLPFKRTYKVLTPFYWLFRIFRLLFFRRNKMQVKLATAGKGVEDIDKVKKLIDSMGMNTIKY